MIKAEMNKKEEQPLDFPKLMVATNGQVILATEEDGANIVGTVVFMGESPSPIGRHLKIWSRCQFSDFLGEITLKNKV